MHVNVKFVKENQQDVQDMVNANAMELVLATKDGRVFLESLPAVVKLNAQIIAAIMENVIVVFVSVMVVGKLKKIALVPIAALIVLVQINFVAVMENVHVKLDSSVLDVIKRMIAVCIKIVPLV